MPCFRWTDTIKELFLYSRILNWTGETNVKKLLRRHPFHIRWFIGSAQDLLFWSYILLCCLTRLIYMMTLNFFELITFLWTDNQFLWTDNFIGTCIWLSFEHVWTKYINFWVCWLQWRIGSDVRPPTPSGVLECHRSFLWWYAKEMTEREDLLIRK